MLIQSCRPFTGLHFVKQIHIPFKNVAYHAAQGKGGGHAVNGGHCAFHSWVVLNVGHRRFQIGNKAVCYAGLGVPEGDTKVYTRALVQAV